MALLSVAFQQQQDLIQQQRGRMDRLLLEFADLRQELEEDPELQLLYAEVRRQRGGAQRSCMQLNKSPYLVILFFIYLARRQSKGEEEVQEVSRQEGLGSRSLVALS